MDEPLLHVTCADLHPDCPALLRARSAEDLVLAYVLHHAECHLTGQVELDQLLASVTVVGPVPRSRAAEPARRALSEV